MDSDVLRLRTEKNLVTDITQQIREFCSTRFGVSFPLSAKIDVNGTGRHPLYAWLTSPANGATVSGYITLGANASDNVGVTRVEF